MPSLVGSEMCIRDRCGSGEVTAKGLVEGVQAGCFPQLYQALGSNPPDQVITL